MYTAGALFYLWKRWILASHNESEFYYFEGFSGYCRILGIDWVLMHYTLSRANPQLY
jgi:hypothetical protein